ncbi:MAG: GNAT family protein [Phaeospirillum sp.]|nr:GNAT family protein [Phaeospirillum sp.]
MEGRFCRVEPLDLDRHAAQLYAGIIDDRDGRTWTYLYYGPFEREEDFHAWLAAAAASTDPQFFTVVDQATGAALGLVSYLRIEAEVGAIAVGHIIFAPSLRRTPAATEGMYLMLRQVFDGLGYRRCEWRCDSLNTKSRVAAERFGFRLEGVFRQACVNKGRNRDTACFSIIDGEWPAIQDCFERWLRPENFDAAGQQRERLSILIQG